MAPEQINDTDAVDARTDVYALGCVLYAMLAGRSAFESAAISELFYRVTVLGPAPLAEAAPRAPLGLVTIVERCMRRAPVDRYATMLDVERALRHFLEEYSGEAALRSVPPPPSEPGSGAAFRSAPTLPMLDSGSTTAPSTGTTGRAVVSSQRGDPPGYVPAPTPLQTVVTKVQWAAVLTVCAGALAAAGFFYARARAVAPATASESTSALRADVAAPSASAPRPAATVGDSTLVVTCGSPGATVRFRGVSAAAPFAMDGIAAGETDEVIEVTAPGRQGRRYRLALGRATTIAASLPAGSGMLDASESELRAALAAKPTAAVGTTKFFPNALGSKPAMPSAPAPSPATPPATPPAPTPARPTLDTDALLPH